MKKSRCEREWICTSCKGKELEDSEKNLGKRDIGDGLGHEVQKLIFKAWLGFAENGKVDTETGKSKSFQSEVQAGKLVVNGEGTDAMEESSLIDEGIEALEKWLKKN